MIRKALIACAVTMSRGCTGAVVADEGDGTWAISRADSDNDRYWGQK